MKVQAIGICLYCQKIIENPCKGKVIKKYCNDDCRNGYHKERRKDNEAMLKEIMAVIEKYRGK